LPKFSLSNYAPWSYNDKIWDQVIISNVYQHCQVNKGLWSPKRQKKNHVFSLESLFEGFYEMPKFWSLNHLCIKINYSYNTRSVSHKLALASIDEITSCIAL